MISASITYRIRIFNKLYYEFHNEINIPNLKFSKIKKYKDFQQYNKEISNNFEDLVKNDFSIFNKIKLLNKYKSSDKLTLDNTKVIFDYIKNMYYTTIENKEDADKIKALLSMSIDTEELIKLFMDDEIGLKSLLDELMTEISPLLEQLNITEEDLTSNNLNMNEILEESMKAGKPTIKCNDPEMKKKLETIIDFIQTKVKSKLESGAINIDTLKMFFNKQFKK